MRLRPRCTWPGQRAPPFRPQGQPPGPRRSRALSRLRRVVRLPALPPPFVSGWSHGRVRWQDTHDVGECAFFRPACRPLAGDATVLAGPAAGAGTVPKARASGQPCSVCGRSERTPDGRSFNSAGCSTLLHKPCAAGGPLSSGHSREGASSFLVAKW